MVLGNKKDLVEKDESLRKIKSNTAEKLAAVCIFMLRQPTNDDHMFLHKKMVYNQLGIRPTPTSSPGIFRFLNRTNSDKVFRLKSSN